jgi:hypothetical protein
VVAKEWIRACAAIEETLRPDLNVAPPLLLTEQEAESRWEKADRTYE